MLADLAVVRTATERGHRAAHGEAVGWDEVSVPGRRRPHPVGPCGDSWHYTPNFSTRCKYGIDLEGRIGSASSAQPAVTAWIPVAGAGVRRGECPLV